MACPQELDTDLLGGNCADVLQAIGFCCVSLVRCCSLTQSPQGLDFLCACQQCDSAVLVMYVAVLSQSLYVLSCRTSTGEQSFMSYLSSACMHIYAHMALPS